MKTITITDVRTLGGSGKVAEIKFTADGKPGTAKAWASDVAPDKTLQVEFEKKPGYNDGPEEVWIKVPRTNGGGRGGPGRADPAKIAVEQERVQLEKTKHGDFLEKWKQDRFLEGHRQAGIMAQVVLKEAVALAIAAQKPTPSAVHAYSLDLTETLKTTHETIFTTIAARETGGL